MDIQSLGNNKHEMKHIITCEAQVELKSLSQISKQEKRKNNFFLYR